MPAYQQVQSHLATLRGNEGIKVGFKRGTKGVAPTPYPPPCPPFLTRACKSWWISRLWVGRRACQRKMKQKFHQFHLDCINFPCRLVTMLAIRGRPWALDCTRKKFDQTSREWIKTWLISLLSMQICRIPMTCHSCISSLFICAIAFLLQQLDNSKKHRNFKKSHLREYHPHNSSYISMTYCIF